MEAWKNNHIDFASIPESLQENGEWEDLKNKDLSTIEYLIIWHHRSSSKNLENLPNLPNLKYLQINWSGITNLKGIERLKGLNRLEMHCCSKLENIGALERLKDTLQNIHLGTCKKIKNHKDLACLKKLRKLRINECGEIEDLKFLEKLPEVSDFRFVGSNVVNGDLSPIIQHPKITSVGMSNKRHYSHKEKEIEVLLSAKTS